MTQAAKEEFSINDRCKTTRGLQRHLLVIPVTTGELKYALFLGQKLPYERPLVASGMLYKERLKLPECMIIHYKFSDNV